MKPRLKFLTSLGASSSLALCALASSAQAADEALSEAHKLSPEMVARVSPNFAHDTDKLLQEVWSRPGLARRDRSLVTIAALIAKRQTIEMPYHFDQALENGVTPAELAEVISHLAFYSGWANANSAVVVADEVFAKRGIDRKQLPQLDAAKLPLDKASDATRTAAVEKALGETAPGLADYTNDWLFHDLWLRPGLAPRDRSLVTLSALVANGQVAQIPFHLNRAMDNGLTQGEASEVLTQLAFYVGWPAAFSAAAPFKQVFDERRQK